jgi:osmotically-inducible protein OsmY
MRKPNGIGAFTMLLCVSLLAPATILGQLTDQQIKQDIEWRFSQNPGLANIEVKVENGEVTLSGAVPNFTTQSAAVDWARSVADVKSVNIENLKVERPPVRNPAQSPDPQRPN